MDPSSLSSLDILTTKHIELEWKVDFDQSKLVGSCVLHLAWNLAPTSGSLPNELVLDTNHLDIHKVQVNYLQGNGFENEDFVLAKPHSKFGRALVISLGQIVTNLSGDQSDITGLKVRIFYQTTPQSTAVQWLKPAQTHLKTHPYVFTQCQAIHARSLLPCQDSPMVKFTYEAKVTCIKPLTALMSAIQVGSAVDNADGTTSFLFRQSVGIPSYLIALAVGNLKGVKIGPRSTVWAEEGMAEKGALEFKDTERFISTAEDIVSKYEWGKYDLLILPPSFPYGGMENPCLTFVTPTIVAGDGSLVDVVAHEISHSWAGNLATTKTWEHFWLNEGFCMFIERKIAGRIHGEPIRQFSSILGWKALEQSIEFFGPDNPLTKLVPQLEGIDPDDAFSSVPYEKGYNLLYYLESILGGPEIFEPYIKAHYAKFAHKTFDTDEWKSFLLEYFSKTHPEKLQVLEKVDWNAWLYEPGMPPTKMPFDTKLVDKCFELAGRWNELSTRPDEAQAAFSSADIQNFSPGQNVVFLERFLDFEALPKLIIEIMDEKYGFSCQNNSEIRFRWNQLCLKANYFPQVSKLAEFLAEQGRMKFVRPLFRDLAKCNFGKDEKTGKQIASELFAKLKAGYHPIASQLIEKDLSV